MKVLDTIAKAEIKNVPVGAIFVASIGMATAGLLSGFISSKLSAYSTKWAALPLNKREDIMNSAVGGGLAIGVPQLGFLGEAFPKVFAIGSGSFAGGYWINRLVGAIKGAKAPAVTGTPAGTSAPAPAPAPSTPSGGGGGSAEAAAQLLTLTS